MSTITKEEALAVADLKAGYTLGHADVVILQELARIALASLEAEPVAYMSRPNAKLREQFGTCDEWDVHHQSVNSHLTTVHIPESNDYEIMPLYTAPPAPVVPDEWEQWIADAVEYLEGGLEADGELEAEGSIEAKRLLSRRAAMLQAGNDSTNGKALTNGDTVANTPDCWIKSS
ncbi:hypothetical protein [Citrobacter sedlakii]|uniref:hypothetical protein n=1 Tax=Citrobacter sedlakii TaxID=67826 RepID=UPI00397BACF9